jgi:hypothetical protein
VNLTTNLHLVLKLGLLGIIPPLHKCLHNLHRDNFSCTYTAIATLVPLGAFTFEGKTMGAQYRLFTPDVMQKY